MGLAAPDAPAADDLRARRFDGEAAELGQGPRRGFGRKVFGALQRAGIGQVLRNRVADGPARHLRAGLPRDFDHLRRDLQPANRFGQSLVMGEDDDLPLLRHHSEHARQTVDFPRVHGLHRIVDDDEPEGGLGQQHPRQEQTEGQGVNLALTHHPEGLAVGSVDADVENEMTLGRRALEFEVIQRHAAVLSQSLPHLRGPLRNGTEPFGPDQVGLRVEPLLRAAQMGDQPGSLYRVACGWQPRAQGIDERTPGLLHAPQLGGGLLPKGVQDGGEIEVLLFQVLDQAVIRCVP